MPAPKRSYLDGRRRVSQDVPSRLVGAMRYTRSVERWTAGLAFLFGVTLGCAPEVDGAPAGDEGASDGASGFGYDVDRGCEPGCTNIRDPNGFYCGCLEGETCSPVGSTYYEGTECIVKPDPGLGMWEVCRKPDGAYAGLDECGAGYTCVPNHSERGYCHPVCVEGECPFAAAWTTPSNVDEVCICLAHCDPFGSHCQHDEVCEVRDPGTFCVTDLSTTPGLGDECGGGLCKAGTHCAQADHCAGSDSCCVQLCQLDGPDSCPGEQACTPIESAWALQYGVGDCR